MSGSKLFLRGSSDERRSLSLGSDILVSVFASFSVARTDRPSLSTTSASLSGFGEVSIARACPADNSLFSILVLTDIGRSNNRNVLAIWLLLFPTPCATCSWV